MSRFSESPVQEASLGFPDVIVHISRTCLFEHLLSYPNVQNLTGTYNYVEAALLPKLFCRPVLEPIGSLSLVPKQMCVIRH